MASLAIVIQVDQLLSGIAHYVGCVVRGKRERAVFVE